ncbi:hypothetical protein [uncultured Sunxiuqinia sp.]|uniref:hypothetical protein n=1 Tax=uncultured Sunxiuqinia sp. TaxID=1573825 RepID=UPI002AA961C5|nr:hypothetical protein [uncultured Sunxiuqinia sp.]
MDSKSILNLISKFLFRKKFLYKWVGRIILISILTELASFALPDSLMPNYEIIKESYGIIPAVILSFFIHRFAGGYSYFSLGIKLLVLIICLIIEYKIECAVNGNKSLKSFVISNFNLGLFNKSTTTINYFNSDGNKK